ncbi:hypothetical protein BDQ12DRAFT_316036 [Crucibulum laeve]|uniref:Uncharacterized protein n=1 Tax=Crucibulum laeve TaxID=68775 RepID=A0A5C3LQI3_9AGAR|nr:hypothetical protein BDQ12DRAFT_316036 [Crucibulum laeve]
MTKYTMTSSGKARSRFRIACQPRSVSQRTRKIPNLANAPSGWISGTPFPTSTPAWEFDRSVVSAIAPCIQLILVLYIDSYHWTQRCYMKLSHHPGNAAIR